MTHLTGTVSVTLDGQSSNSCEVSLRIVEALPKRLVFFQMFYKWMMKMMLLLQIHCSLTVAFRSASLQDLGMTLYKVKTKAKQIHKPWGAVY